MVYGKKAQKREKKTLANEAEFDIIRKRLSKRLHRQQAKTSGNKRKMPYIQNKNAQCQIDESLVIGRKENGVHKMTEVSKQ